MSKNRNNGQNRQGKVRTLDFNTVERPTLRLIMQDEARTEINVTMPAEGLIEELQFVRPKFEAMATGGDKFDARQLYELAAKLMSSNRELRTLTAEDLAGKYRMNMESLVIFFGAYVDFVEAVQNLKN